MSWKLPVNLWAMLSLRGRKNSKNVFFFWGLSHLFAATGRCSSPQNIQECFLCQRGWRILQLGFSNNHTSHCLLLTELGPRCLRDTRASLWCNYLSINPHKHRVCHLKPGFTLVQLCICDYPADCFYKGLMIYLSELLVQQLCSVSCTSRLHFQPFHSTFSLLCDVGEGGLVPVPQPIQVCSLLCNESQPVFSLLSNSVVKNSQEKYCQNSTLWHAKTVQTKATHTMLHILSSFLEVHTSFLTLCFRIQHRKSFLQALQKVLFWFQLPRDEWISQSSHISSTPERLEVNWLKLKLNSSQGKCFKGMQY